MHHNKNRSIEIFRQMFGEVTKRLYAARRRSDDDDGAFVHLVNPPTVNRSYIGKRVDRLFRSHRRLPAERRDLATVLVVADVH
jgi:hypothetical protein